MGVQLGVERARGVVFKPGGADVSGSLNVLRPSRSAVADATRSESLQFGKGHSDGLVVRRAEPFVTKRNSQNGNALGGRALKIKKCNASVAGSRR